MSYTAENVNIVRGLSDIVNLDNIKPGIDLKELEKQMINGGIMTEKTKDPTDRFNDELQDISKKLGISFGDIDDSTIEPVTIDQQSSSSSSDGYQPHPQLKRSPSPPRQNRFAPSNLQSRTIEQERRQHIDSVIRTGDNYISIEKEKKEDDKYAMLAEIDSLMASLVDEDIDLSRIPVVNRHSPCDEVESVLKILRHKSDHTRYCSFAEEFIMFGAYALEELFDGQRTWFGRYQPDLTGWHNSVHIKMRRMRHDTGQLVSGVMQDYNIGPGARVLLELVPNMIVYSKTRKQQHSQPGLFSDEAMMVASQKLRDV
jgi:hypothetical protein